MQRLLGACCCLLALGLATRAAGLSDEKAIEEAAEKSGLVNSDSVATNLRNVRAAEPKKRGEKEQKQSQKKEKEIQKEEGSPTQKNQKK